MADVVIIVDQGAVVRVERRDRGRVYEGVKDILNIKDLIDLARRTNPVPVVSKFGALISAQELVKDSPHLTEEQKAESLAQLNSVYIWDDVSLSERAGELAKLQAENAAAAAPPAPPVGGGAGEAAPFTEADAARFRENWRWLTQWLAAGGPKNLNADQLAPILPSWLHDP